MSKRDHINQQRNDDIATTKQNTTKLCAFLWDILHVVCCFRLYHIDDVPSGAGGEHLDFNKAYAVSKTPRGMDMTTLTIMLI